MKRAEFHIIYVSVNAIREGSRRRTKDAIVTGRHVFLEADRDGPALIRRIRTRSDLPPLSYMLESSPGRVHVFWRVTGFTALTVERLERFLARDLDTDIAATTCSQTTRLPGYQQPQTRALAPCARGLHGHALAPRARSVPWSAGAVSDDLAPRLNRGPPSNLA
jgi:hypothetical protein